MYNICDNSLVTLNINNNNNNNNSKTLCEGGCAIKPSSQHGAGFAKATLLLRGKEAIPGREAQKEVGAGDHADHVLVMVPMIWLDNDGQYSDGWEYDAMAKSTMWSLKL